MDNFIVGQNQNKVFTGKVGQSKGHFIVIIFAEIRI